LVFKKLAFFGEGLVKKLQLLVVLIFGQKVE